MLKPLVFLKIILMQDAHKDLCQRYPLYRRWHQLPLINALHFVMLMGVGTILTSTIVTAVYANAPDVTAAPNTAAAEHRQDTPGIDFGPWFSISKWGSCKNLMQQGTVFELQNEEGQSMWSACSAQVPKGPTDWNSAPTRFRLVKEPLPQHSEPHPLPVNSEN